MQSEGTCWPSTGWASRIARLKSPVAALWAMPCGRQRVWRREDGKDRRLTPWGQCSIVEAHKVVPLPCSNTQPLTWTAVASPLLQLDLSSALPSRAPVHLQHQQATHRDQFSSDPSADHCGLQGLAA